MKTYFRQSWSGDVCTLIPSQWRPSGIVPEPAPLDLVTCTVDGDLFHLRGLAPDADLRIWFRALYQTLLHDPSRLDEARAQWNAIEKGVLAYLAGRKGAANAAGAAAVAATFPKTYAVRPVTAAGPTTPPASGTKV